MNDLVHLKMLSLKCSETTRLITTANNTVKLKSQNINVCNNVIMLSDALNVDKRLSETWNFTNKLHISEY